MRVSGGRARQGKGLREQRAGVLGDGQSLRGEEPSGITQTRSKSLFLRPFLILSH